MKRFKLTLAYDGTPFYGWQRQDGFATVQGVLEEALYDFLGVLTPALGSGRTDAGVHAEGQVAHVELAQDYPPSAIQGALNQRLREVPITILRVEEVEPSFHARFSATARSYRYQILNRRARPALEKNRVWWVAPTLCEEKMAMAAAFLVGHHDFSSFRAAHCQAASPLKTLDVLTVEREGDFIFVKAKARSFLHHQVRNIVGTLKKVGQGVWSPEKIKEILEARDRRQAGPTAPAEGLYLTAVDYMA
jgi:tRNA pseudouridine38-40 synthase